MGCNVWIEDIISISLFYLMYKRELIKTLRHGVDSADQFPPPIKNKYSAR